MALVDGERRRLAQFVGGWNHRSSLCTKVCLRSSLRHDHQIAAINKRHIPNGSGTKKRPKDQVQLGI